MAIIKTIENINHFYLRACDGQIGESLEKIETLLKLHPEVKGFELVDTGLFKIDIVKDSMIDAIVCTNMSADLDYSNDFMSTFVTPIRAYIDPETHLFFLEGADMDRELSEHEVIAHV